MDLRSGPAVSDRSTWYGISLAAKEILQQCVESSSTGGVVKNIGKHVYNIFLAIYHLKHSTFITQLLGTNSNLILSILPYTPQVICAPSRAGHPSPNLTLCNEITGGMVATTQTQVFGPKDAPGVQVILPQSLNLLSPEGSCELVINSRRSLDSTSWFEIYTGAAAVQAMCVRKGEGGISRQGVVGNIIVFLKSGSQAATAVE